MHECAVAHSSAVAQGRSSTPTAKQRQYLCTSSTAPTQGCRGCWGDLQGIIGYRGGSMGHFAARQGISLKYHHYLLLLLLVVVVVLLLFICLCLLLLLLLLSLLLLLLSLLLLQWNLGRGRGAMGLWGIWEPAQSPGAGWQTVRKGEPTVPLATPNLPANIIPTEICWLKLSGTFPMGLGIPPLKLKIMLESNPLRSRILVRRLAVPPEERRIRGRLENPAGWLCGTLRASCQLTSRGNQIGPKGLGVVGNNWFNRVLVSSLCTCSDPHVDRCLNPLPWDPLSSPWITVVAPVGFSGSGAKGGQAKGRHEFDAMFIV